MTPKRVAVKFFTSPDPEQPVDLEPFIPLFHGFIQKASVPGLLIDVADYAHVPNGPGVVLIGHEVDYAMDSTSGRAGLLTVCKRAGDTEFGELLHDTLRKALVALEAIVADGSGQVEFDVGGLQIEVFDRLAAGNADAGFEAVKAAALPVLKTLYGDVEVANAGSDDARKGIQLHVTARKATDVDTLLERLGGVGAPAAGAVPGPAVPGQTKWDISAEQLQQLREEGADFLLIDVREPSEVEICEIGAQVIPLGTLEDRMGELDSHAHLVVHCHTGARSSHAVNTLRSAGFGNVWNLQGGIRAWIQRIDSSLQDY